MEVLHSDGTRDNNALSNLRYGTHAENCEDTARHGRAHRGAKHHMTKLTEADVLNIRESNWSGVALAARYGVTPDVISKIRHRKSWGWLK